MNNFSVSIDKYITSEPYNDGFDEFVEMVYEEYSDDFYNQVYELDTNFENSEIENNWLNKLFDKKIPYVYSEEDFKDIAKFSAAMIERAYNLYLKNN